MRIEVRRIDASNSWIVHTNGKISAASTSLTSAEALAAEAGSSSTVGRVFPEVSKYAFVWGVASVAPRGVHVHGITSDPDVATRVAQEVGGEIRLVRLGADDDESDVVLVDEDQYRIL